ncbi:hypothetical protein B0G84_5007 [Paraburkholderia sp. BL8N3]|nr:hypothetical protein [Paraburkholderia sp. BL8N3]TCK39667.1 hypothetical protein B0G84_5007 [Paraburkholderia sp. BL8N3]
MNVKPGDLAYIVRSDVPENVGAVVEVVSFDEFHASMCGVPVWKVRTGRPLRNGWGEASTEGSCCDEQLRPISGVPVDDETPLEINLAEAMKLALGIEMRAWA